MNKEWMLEVLEWISNWGFNWFIDCEEYKLVVEKKNKRVEKLELWEVFRISRMKWMRVYGDEFEDGVVVFKVFNGYGRWESVEYSEEGLKKVLVNGVR